MKFTLIFVLISITLVQPSKANQPYKNMLEAEQALAQVLQEIQVKYASDTLFLKKLDASQAIWLDYRAVELEMQFPEEDKLFHYGTAFKQCRMYILIDMTSKRIEKLKAWPTPYIEGDICNGSKK